jgi:hypothetical protein
MVTKDDINAIKCQLELQTRLLVDACTQQNIPSTSPRATRLLTIPNMNIPLEEMGSKLKRFSEEFEIALQLFFRFLPIGFQNLLLTLPHLFLLCQLLLQRLPQIISLVLHDNISFEEALGRVHSLQFQQFKHWATFEASLRCAFETHPGFQRVVGGSMS